ncbi:MAG TPA: hypothetical protein VFC56_05465 [Stellaceae bacterium]|nr:hypothetical protein [Stellaceae bacterium]
MIRRIRLLSGLVMLAYVAMHLLNHALGLVSIPAMGWALTEIVYPVWSLPPMRFALYGAFAVHYTLALWALWQRQTLRLRAGECLQLVLGFLIPIRGKQGKLSVAVFPRARDLPELEIEPATAEAPA